MIPSNALIKKIWDNTLVTNDCWIWQGSKNPAGYGNMWTGERYDRPHRIVWCYANNSWIANGQQVCHHCDNPSCVNPDHLFIGTSKDNHQDMIAKGRQNRPDHVGINHPRTFFTEDDIHNIRLALSKGTRPVELARKYGLSISTVQSIKTQNNWSHITYQDELQAKIDSVKYNGHNSSQSTLTNEAARRIKLALKSGVCARMLAKYNEVSVHVISMINTGRTWRHVQI